MSEYVRVRTESDTRLDHIAKLGVFFDGQGKSLCGKRAWPGKWEEAQGQAARVVCADCREKFGRQRG